MHNNVLHDFIFESDPELINLTDSSKRGFKRILFIDSLFDFFPRVEVFFADPTGIIPDRTYFIEGLDFNIKMGNENDGFIGGDYIWANNEFQDTRIEDSYSGTSAGIFVSKHFYKEQPQRRSWNDTIKSVVDEIATSDYNILDSTKKFISSTIGSDYWYQASVKNSTFIQDLSDYAYNLMHNKSPFYSFINTNGEFYFMHLNELFNQQSVNPLNPYKLSLSREGLLDLYNIQNYFIQYPGVETNFENYKIKSYETGSSGTSSSKTQELKDTVYKDATSKLLIRKQYVEENSVIYNGINESSQDSYNYKGFINSLFRDSVLSYRKQITIPFNPKVVSGKTIELEIGSSDENKEVSKEFSGKWLVLTTQHHMNMDGMPFSNILIGKSSMFVDSKHKLYGDFQ